ncbi:Hint domain-containing protein [Acetobacter conturbans]|uniref:Hedgehog/Intein (Hint) domain-containing protein n=1 Tax=Acetobacter conturbans TaxID=1737472 RepID=A0ABX0JXU4_9PROT|nr:Hint domain-containing protein [Acetobacter conturbans]NHN88322.1 hypothetical protein [Acetobacter conturbans]
MVTTATTTQYAAYTSGAGTEASPYVLASSSGTVTLQPGKYYVLEDGASIGTAVIKEYNASGSTGGINVNGAHLTVDSDGTTSVAGTINMNGKGSSLVLNNETGKWSYEANLAGEDISAGGDQYYTYPALQNATITNFGSGSSICTNNVPGGLGSTIGINSSYVNSSTLILKKSSSIPVTASSSNPNANAGSGYYGISVTGVGGTYSKPSCSQQFYTNKGGDCIQGCFLPGSHILTRTGEKAVETLVEGDEIAVIENGETVFRPLAWLGRSHADVAALGFDVDAYPVRIRKDAFGEGAPHRDLVVTSEHCIHIDGRFTPVRMLVNGRSIAIDRSITAYDFYHVELEQHGVIVSEGLETESYLDTGNRGTFENSTIRTMRPHFAGGVVIAGGKSWERDAGAPLVTDRATVEPIWNILAARAETLSFPGIDTTSTETTTDPDLRLVSEDGREMRPVRHMGNTYCFMVPSSIADVRIVTRTARPTDMIGPFCDDRRHLGVVVGEVAVTNGRDRRPLNAHLSNEELDGWQAYEGGVGRWTAGNALLSLNGAGEGLFARMIEIEVLAAGPYAIDSAVSGGVQVA